MRILGLIVTLLSVSSALATWTVNPSPTVDSLGTIISSATPANQHFLTNTNGHNHFIAYYTADYQSSASQIASVNFNQSSVHLTNINLGRFSPRGTAYTNGWLYVGTYDTPDFQGNLVKYHLVTGATQYIGKLTQNLTPYMDFGEDGWLYIGNATNGSPAHVDRLRLSDDTLESLGDIDPTYAGSPIQYAYSLGADTKWLYVGFGQNPWYLGVYDTVAATNGVWWKTASDTSGYIFRGRTGGWFYQRQGPDTGGAKWWYALTNGEPTFTSSSSTFYTNVYYSDQILTSDQYRAGVIDKPVEATNDTGFEVDLGQAYPSSLNNTATFAWRQTNTLTWSSAQVSNFTLTPAVLKRVYPQGVEGGKLHILAYFYGPIISVDTSGSNAAILGHSPFSLYDGVSNGTNWYYSGYPATTLRHTPGSTWTLSVSTTDKEDPSVNPYRIPLQIGKYHYYSTFGSDGKLYIGSHHERDSTGGSLGWYNPTDESFGSERTEFLLYDVRDLKPAVNGTKLIYASSNARIFTWDVATFTKDSHYTVLDGMTLNKIVEYESGKMFGFSANHMVTFTTTGTQILSNNIPTAPWGSLAEVDKRLTLGPDQRIWVISGGNLLRINPQDLTYSTVKNVTNSSLNIVFDRNRQDAYLYGGTTLYKMPNLLTRSGRIRARAGVP